MFVNKNVITFEIPMHFLVKSALKLESLLRDLQTACEASHAIIHQHALLSCLEVINISNKPELKSRFLKEFLRIEHNLEKSGVSINTALTSALSRNIRSLSNQAGTFTKLLINDPFIQAIRSTHLLNTQEMDNCSPKLVLWMNTEYQERQNFFKRWIEELTPLTDLIQTYLSILRQMVLFDEIFMHQGFYQCTLPAASTCQLVLLRLPKEDQIIPHIQLGHHRLTLTLQKAFSMEKIKFTPHNLELGLCQL
mgnify:CR=1 FL=1